jgi:hypothetical protein
MASLLLKLADGEGQSIRGKEHEGAQCFSVYDFMSTACGKVGKVSYAKNTFSRLVQDGSEYKNEVDTLCVYLKFSGTGQRETPCMTIRGLQRLLMILGGKVAADFRAIVEGTFTRVMAGDQSLIEVINANAASQAPVQQAFRAALEQEPVVEPALDEYCLGQKREREELDIAERRLRLEQDRHELEASKRDKAMEHTSKAVALIKSFTTIDERTKLQFGDHVKNIILSSSQSFFVGGRALSNGKTESPSPHAPISISSVATKLGYKPSSNDAQRIGGNLRKRYIEVHNKPPSKHDQLCDGRVTSVNSYTEHDRHIVEEVLHAHFSLTESDEDNTYDACEVAARELAF